MEVLAMILVLLACVLIGLISGILIGTNRMKKAVEEGSVGHLRIDRSEKDEAPRPFLELAGSSIDSISQKQFVILKVINENYLSRD